MEKNIVCPFEFKDGDEGVTGDGVIRGLASTFGGAADDGGDIVEPGAFQKTISKGGRNRTGIKFLSQHGRYDKNPIGIWNSLVETPRGLDSEGKLAIGDPMKAEGTQLANETFALAKLRALDAMSIGWDFPRNKSGKIKDGSFEIKDGVRHLKEIELWEISLVTFPMNINARVTNVKGIKDATTERELESALREAGISVSDSKWLVNLAKPSLREAGKINNIGLEAIQIMLQKLENDIKV